MPVASSSRRNRRLQPEPSSDGIEDVPSQARTVDEVDDDDDDDDDIEAPVPTKALKRSKKPKTATVDPEMEIKPADDPLANFGDNHPLDKGTATKNIAGMTSDWVQMREVVHSNSYELIRDVASTVAEFTDAEHGDKYISDIDTMMRSLVDTENELRAHEDALRELQQKIAKGDEIDDIITYFEEAVEQNVRNYQKKTTRQKYAKNEEYVNFRQAVYEVKHPGGAMPPLTDDLDKEPGDESDDEEDIAIGGVTQDYKCPLSLTLFVEPMTAHPCGHSFSSAAIKEYLDNSHTARKKCPTSGCNHIIGLSNLKLNKELAKKAKEAARRERMRDDEDEFDEEIIE